MSSHLWVLSNLIFPENSEPHTPLNTLLRYTVTTSHSKMQRRFEHAMSKLHLKSLGKVKDFPFNPELQLDTDRDKMTNDRALVAGFVSRTKTEPHMITSSIPNIQLFCENLPHENEPFQLYTSETCTEFHILLVELLTKFYECLRKLGEIKKSLALLDNGCDAFKVNCNDFKRRVGMTLALGHALLRIARGSAFEMHLQNIATLLEDHRDTEISMPMSNLAMEEEEDVEKEDEVLGEELLPVLSNITDLGEPMPLWKTYRDWMRLMVVHFDAAIILTRYSSSQTLPKIISVNILLTPRVDEACLSFTELLNDPNLFPITDLSGKLDPTSNDEILKFFTNAFKLSEAATKNQKTVQSIKNIWMTRDSKKFRANVICGELKNLAKLLPDDDKVKKVLDQLLQWKKDPQSVPVEGITDQIDSLCGELTAKMNSASLPIDSETKFSGTLHCETCLASILHERTRATMVEDEYKDLLTQTEVDYHFSDLSM